ncbi:MAG: hypothetical protein M0038_17180, partial [Pseudomonadota bacterium]|nr:hypothetical protein [Pseudomonadota bacterium]
NPAEIADISANPWQVFHKRQRFYSIIQSSGDIGTGASTESADTSAGTGTIALSGTGTSAESADTSAGTGTIALSGTGASTESPDTSAGTGTIALSGTGTSTEGADTSAATGTLAIDGSAADTEGADTSIGTGSTAGVIPGDPYWLIQRSLPRNFTIARTPTRSFTIARALPRFFGVTSMADLFPTKAPSELIPLTFDFTQDLPTGVTLTGTPAITVITVRGTDAAPANVLNGAAGFNTAKTQVIQPVKGGQNGATYRITCNCPTTQANLAPTLVGELPVEENIT